MGDGDGFDESVRSGKVEIDASGLPVLRSYDGEGIEPQYQDKIYTIFQTLQARDLHESTGIGLAIVKKIVETEGGTIGLQSSLGQGQRFALPGSNSHSKFSAPLN